jgi:hypothetical protein
MADDKEEPFRKGESEPFRKTIIGKTSGEPGSYGASLSTEKYPDQAPAAGNDVSADAPETGDANADAGSDAHADAAQSPLAPSASGPQKIQKVKKPSAAPGLAAALIIGALSGFGGAYALRYVDALQGPDSADRGADANARAAALERKTEESAAALVALESRLAAVESNAGQASASTEAALTDVRNSIAEQRLAASADGRPAEAQIQGRQLQTPELGPIREKIDAFEKKLGSLDSRVQKKLGELEVPFATPKPNPAAEQGAKALAVAQSEGVVAASLVQLVSRGEPFANEVAALENLGVDPAKLAPLRAAAASGVASIGDLSDQFAALASSLEDAAAPTPETGVIDRLVRDASNLVRVRRAGDPHDTDVPGRIAAIKAALARLDVAKAYAAWLQLPDAAKARSVAWGDAAKARLDALVAANAIAAEAVTALSKSKS